MKLKKKKKKKIVHMTNLKRGEDYFSIVYKVKFVKIGT